MSGVRIFANGNYYYLNCKYKTLESRLAREKFFYGGGMRRLDNFLAKLVVSEFRVYSAKGCSSQFWEWSSLKGLQL